MLETKDLIVATLREQIQSLRDDAHHRMVAAVVNTMIVKACEYNSPTLTFQSKYGAYTDLGNSNMI